jgi:pimeloyl-ACP methyl ester carboxylesterase
VRSRLAVTAARASAIAAAIASLTIASGCRSERASARGASPGSPVEEPCTGVPVSPARCYRVAVSENRDRPTGRSLGLRVVVLPATGADRAPDPIFPLAGGPGQAATDLLYDPSLAQGSLREHRDLVFADQRGTGGSHALTCRFYGPPEDAQSYFDAFLPIDKVRACRAWLERGADLKQYTTATSVEDLDAIRAAFGFAKINLVGGSYGTRLAMEYVRAHEPNVRSVVLESPVTPANHVPEGFGLLAAQALDGLLDECLATPDCASAFPRIREEAKTVFERLRESTVTATTSHPARSHPAQVTLTRDHVGEAIRYLLYSSGGASRVPLYLHRAFLGDYSPIADFLIRWRAEGTFDGLYLSITCAEDVPFVAPDAAGRDDPTFLGSYRVRQQRAACDAWPKGLAPPDSRAPVTASVPVLITSGTLDPVTPPANGDEIARTLAHSVHVRVPSGGHSPSGLSGTECLSQITRNFVEAAKAEGLDTACVANIRRTGFLLK